MLQKSVKASMQDWFLMRCLMMINASKYCFFFGPNKFFSCVCSYELKQVLPTLVISVKVLDILIQIKIFEDCYILVKF